MTRQPILTLSTRCAACPHPYNWHRPGSGCQAGDEEKHCGCIGFASPAPAAPRHTADTITDDALDALYRRIETLEHVAAGNKRHVQRLIPELQRAEAALDRVRAALDEFCHEPHPDHDHVCPDDVRRHVLAALDEPKEPRP
ncbi:hypothetical protein ACF068_14650 [Streptomyces sp. NPDC016309]|uniref:hypothetical protein n=1 Tax=Streptomyces sp. NPDC016309 TaxID=3364965 RepID=UPI0036FD3561